MRCPVRWLVAAAVLFGLTTRLAVGQEAKPGAANPPGITAEAIRQGIERGTNYLKRQQNVNGSWSEWLGQPAGESALCTLALLEAGVPSDDESIRRALDYLRKFRPEKTYATALQTMVFCRVGKAEDMGLIRRNVEALERWQIRDGANKGAWSYPSGPGDNSNTQFALLALHEAERLGVQVNLRTWRLAEAYWRQCQNPDGSWGYVKGMPGSGSMTAAGITSMVIASGHLGEPDAAVEGGQIKCCQRGEKTNDPVERALQWMGANFSVTYNPGVRTNAWLLYYLYGLERVGRLTAHRFIGEHDWYREGADYVIKIKGGPLADHWRGVGPTETDERLATAFALLFLSKGRWPVLLSKVKHGPEDQWNAHRNDVNNLTRYVESQWKRDVIWQVVDIEAASVEDLLQSPVLYYCGKNSPLPAGAGKRQELAQKIRDYIDRGGFLFAEAYCGGEGFDQGFRKLMETVFPEPEYRLRMLTPDHPIWRTEEPVTDPRPMEGIEYGCRTSVVYCPPDHSPKMRPPLSCLWELSRAGRDRDYPAGVKEQVQTALKIGNNVLGYATNRELKNREETIFNTPPEKTQGDAIRRGKLYIASLKHPGGCSAAPRALTNLLLATAENLKLRVNTEPKEIAITDPALFDYHLVFMHGRNAFRLTDAERKQLKTYIQRGGLVLADAICASRPFADSFQRELRAMFPEQPLQPVPRNDPMLTPAYGGSDLSLVTRRDPQLRSKAEPLKALRRQVPPELEGIKIGDRWGVVFSRYDLSCALEKQDSVECQGYTREDAAKIGVNVVLYSLQQ